ncbi:SH3 domain-containing protein [Aquibium carbonis]|uniref:SH3 domain-containing protein n=2 Tax=Aquibium carbonis TaxID=2495581 RepID=A0A3S0G2Q7_9HYPH|nr:SH3 domain-containing protein [Aquibium carbonis]
MAVVAAEAPATVQQASSPAQPEAPVSPTVAAAPAAKSARVADIPRKDDPRWARAETRQGSPALEAVRKLIVEKAAQVDEGGSDLLAYAGNDRGMSAYGDDASATRRPMQIVLPAELPTQVDDETRTVSVNAPVNMRKGPGAKHGVMMVIPRQAKVSVIDCDQWCKISYEGRTGYIYKSFVRGRAS